MKYLRIKFPMNIAKRLIKYHRQIDIKTIFPMPHALLNFPSLQDKSF